MDILSYNRKAWDAQAQKGCQWTVPVSQEVLAKAKCGEWEIILTPTRAVPQAWFPPLLGRPVLCLASGGGQQAPVLAAAGADVTSLDNSPAQLASDRQAADLAGVSLRTLLGNMADLSVFKDESFDLIVHPVSNCFVPAIGPVWQEAYRVLRPGGLLLSGICNPLLYLFDEERADQGELLVRHAIPYSDLTSLTESERKRYADRNEPLNFGHTLEDQVGGQLAAGFVLTGFYEDTFPGHPVSDYISTFFATRAWKLPAK